MSKDQITTNEKSVILKLDHSNNPQKSNHGVMLQKINSSIPPSSFIKLVRFANNDINPRNATDNSIFDSICTTLERQPEKFEFMSKGIVAATKRCDILDRNRVRITLFDPIRTPDEDKRMEGIMDGGHNTFAIAWFIVSKCFDNLKQWKSWKDMKEFFDANYEELLERFNTMGGDDCETFKFSVPIEIISPIIENPNEEDPNISEYCDSICDISDARNNNVQLKESAKDNQDGCYDYLKEVLPSTKYPIAWKPGQEGGKIKVEDVVSLVTLPFYYLQSIGKLDPTKYGTINKISIYSQKSSCIRLFGKVLTSDEFSKKPVGEGKYVLTSNLIKSALDMTEDIMKFYDRLYEKFPKLYNSTGGSFGNISGVKNQDNMDYRFGTVSRKATHKYSHGFFYPILCGITELMRYDPTTDTIGWKINPASPSFKIEDLDITIFAGFFPDCSYNPNAIGKSISFYNAAAASFKFYLLAHMN